MELDIAYAYKRQIFLYLKINDSVCIVSMVITCGEFFPLRNETWYSAAGHITALFDALNQFTWSISAKQNVVS